MNSGFLPGDSLQDRMAALAEPKRVRALIPGLRAGVNAFLGKAVEVVRSRFGGKVKLCLASIRGRRLGTVDIIATDAGYRTGEIAPRFRDDIRAFVAQGRGKPVAITEFGCATYRGAADLGTRDDAMIEWGDRAQAIRLKGDFTRDEDEQARYLAELLNIFEAEGVSHAFVYTFARYDLPYRICPPFEDLDLASKGVVKVLDGRQGQSYPDMPWEPKAAFTALAEIYGRWRAHERRSPCRLTLTSSKPPRHSRR